MSSTTVAVERRDDPEWSQGDRFRKARTEAGYTQREFAALLDVKAPTYAAWESDRTTCPRLTAIAKRVEVLTGVRAVWLLGLDEPAPLPPSPSVIDEDGLTTHRYLPRKRHLELVGTQAEPSQSVPALDAPAARTTTRATA